MRLGVYFSRKTQDQSCSDQRSPECSFHVTVAQTQRPVEVPRTFERASRSPFSRTFSHLRSIQKIHCVDKRYVQCVDSPIFVRIFWRSKLSPTVRGRTQFTAGDCSLLGHSSRNCSSVRYSSYNCSSFLASSCNCNCNH